VSVFNFEHEASKELEVRVAHAEKARAVAKEKVNVTRIRRGAVRTKAIYDLAQDVPITVIAKRYCTSPATVKDFALEYADEVNLVRQDLATAVAREATNLWVTDKLSRMTEYQQALTDLENEIVRLIENGKTQNVAGLIKIKFQGLRHVAEELGELPPRVAIQNNNTMVNYTLEGVDMEAL
jgi:hypothetical protein